MKRTILILMLMISGSTFAGDADDVDLYANKTYQQGFDAGIAWAMGTWAYKAHGMADTPYPVEVPSWSHKKQDDDWGNTRQGYSNTACVNAIWTGLNSGGGGVNMLYLRMRDNAPLISLQKATWTFRYPNDRSIPRSSYMRAFSLKLTRRSRLLCQTH